MIEHLNAAPQMPSRVVILGGSGFIGKKLCARLDNVLAIDSVTLDLAAANADSELASILQPTDAVVFLSALSPSRGNSSDNLCKNIVMASTVLKALQKSPCTQVIYASSEAVYGMHQTTINADTEPAPDTVYGVMHLSRELLLKGELQDEIPLFILRLSQVYGDGCTHNAYGPNKFLRTAGEGRYINIFGEGEDARDFVYIDDVVEVIIQALRYRSYGTTNVASGLSLEYRELASFIAGKYQGTIINSQPRKLPAMKRTININELEHAYANLQFKTVYEALV